MRSEVETPDPTPPGFLLAMGRALQTGQTLGVRALYLSPPPARARTRVCTCVSAADCRPLEDGTKFFVQMPTSEFRAVEAQAWRSYKKP